jgi:phage-related baseplate assembly protein
LEFDPIKVTMEAGASFEMNALTRVNQMGRSVTLAFAWGANLDAIASRYPGGVPRLPEETYADDADPAERDLKDNRYRRRIWLAPNALAASGTAESYVYWAMTVDGDLKDASAIVRRAQLREDPVVFVTCLSNGADPRPSEARLKEILLFLRRPEIKPLTDVVAVAAPIIKHLTYSVGLYLWPDADQTVVEALVRENLNAVVVDQYWLGEDHTHLAISHACKVPGVQNIRIDQPPTSVAADDRTAILVDGITIRTLGRRT